MQQLIQTVLAAWQRTLHFLLTTERGRWVAIGLAVLIVAVVVRKLMKVLKRPTEVSLVDPLRVVDLGGEPLGSAGRESLKVHNMPARLGVVALAPLGRLALPSDEDIPAVLEGLVPGLGHFFALDKPAVRHWPNQVSVGGFANNLALHLQVPGKDLSETPWCLVAGKTKWGDGLLLVTLGLAAARPNRLGVVRLEDESDWMQAIQVAAAETA
jgi:hypothetical protein